jgi:hypothetical protein
MKENCSTGLLTLLQNSFVPVILNFPDARIGKAAVGFQETAHHMSRILCY